MIQRGKFNEIILSSVPSATMRMAQNLVHAVTNAAKVDEHGSWNFDAEFDKKGRGYATNWDLYGYGRDAHNRRFLCVIQVRQYEKIHKNWWPSVRKNYYLLGRNEDGSVFAHPVPSRTVQGAANKGRDVVMACQSWIFGAEYQKVIRHGDLALVPVRKHCGERQEETNMVIEESHQLEASEIFVNGSALYVRNPRLRHMPGVHPEVERRGLYKLVTGKRAPFWKFAAPTID